LNQSTRIHKASDEVARIICEALPLPAQVRGQRNTHEALHELGEGHLRRGVVRRAAG
jgi:hypothetical protein